MLRGGMPHGALALSVREGDWVKVFDGPDEDAPVLQQLRMKALPAAAFVSSGRFLHVQMVTNDAGIASGFSAAVSCVCADAPAWHDFATASSYASSCCAARTSSVSTPLHRSVSKPY